MPTETATAASGALTTFAVVVMMALLAHYFIERWLLNRHLKWVAAHRPEVPAPFAAQITLAEHQRAADYTLAKGALGRIEAAVGLVVSALILFGGLARLWGLTAPLADSPVLREVALVALLSAVTGLVGIPFGYYSTFFIEEKFGFNKTTRATFWLDLVKGTVLSAVLLLPLAALATARNRLVAVAWGLGSLGLGYWLFLQDAAEGLYKNYVEAEYQSSGALVRLAMNLVPAVILLLWRRRFRFSTGERRLWILFALVSLALFGVFLVSPASTAVDRIALYMLPLQLVVFAHLPDVLTNPKEKDVGPMVLAVVGFYGLVQFVWLNFADHAFAWVPYRFYPLEAWF